MGWRVEFRGASTLEAPSSGMSEAFEFSTIKRLLLPPSKPLWERLMLVNVLIGLAVVVVLFVITAMLRSNDLRVSRSMKMAVPAATAFAQVNDLHLMNVWNPWLKLDPQAKQTYEGAMSGVGAIYSWDGNSHVGAGRQTIVETQPNDFVKIRLDFFRPFAGVNDVMFTFVPDGNHTTVTWAMTGKMHFIAKAMGIFFSMEKMCGDSFEKGLAEMKSIVEA